MTYWILGAALWLACGVIDAGFIFASFQRQYPSIRLDGFRGDQGIAVVALVAGPMGLISFCMVDFPVFRHGWLWPWSAKARIEAEAEA